MTNHKASLIVGHVFHLAEILPCFNGGSLVATPRCNNNNEGRYYSRGRSSVPMNNEYEFVRRSGN